MTTERERGVHVRNVRNTIEVGTRWRESRKKRKMREGQICAYSTVVKRKVFFGDKIVCSL